MIQGDAVTKFFSIIITLTVGTVISAMILKSSISMSPWLIGLIAAIICAGLSAAATYAINRLKDDWHLTYLTIFTALFILYIIGNVYGRR